MSKRKTRSLADGTKHIIFDAVECDPEPLDDEQEIVNLLLTITKTIDMKVLNGPNITRDHNPENEGLTGTAIISYSHVTIHTFPNERKVYIDIFSCKPFDRDAVTAELYDVFCVEDDQVEVFEVRYPWED